jgi:hypothetical protein
MPEFREKVRIDDVECVAETDKALRVIIDDHKEWIPKSQVDDDSEVFDADKNSRGTLVISQWIATQKRLW